MLIHEPTTIERSQPVVNELIQNRSQECWEGLTVDELVDVLALGGLQAEVPQIGIVIGGAASGKTTMVEDMLKVLARRRVRAASVSGDDFVCGDRGQRREWEAAGKPPEDKYNLGRLCEVIRAVFANRDPEQVVEAPKYDAQTGRAIDGERKRLIPMVDVLLVDGDVLGKPGESPRTLCPEGAGRPMVLYVDVSDEERLRRRIERDMAHRNGHGETPDIIAANFEHRQRRQHMPYTLGYAACADVIVRPVGMSESGAPLYDVYIMQQP